MSEGGNIVRCDWGEASLLEKVLGLLKPDRCLSSREQERGWCKQGDLKILGSNGQGECYVFKQSEERRELGWGIGMQKMRLEKKVRTRPQRTL